MKKEMIPILLKLLANGYTKAIDLLLNMRENAFEEFATQKNLNIEKVTKEFVERTYNPPVFEDFLSTEERLFFERLEIDINTPIDTLEKNINIITSTLNQNSGNSLYIPLINQLNQIRRKFNSFKNNTQVYQDLFNKRLESFLKETKKKSTIPGKINFLNWLAQHINNPTFLLRNANLIESGDYNLQYSFGIETQTK